jgi:hypothetical protein
MPTVLLERGYRFHFYASDRDEPAHVHVSRAEGYAKVWLEPSVAVQYFYNYKARERREIMAIIARREDLLKDAWHDFFGK